MNLLQDSADADADRKRIKSQLEKRRRERMKRSLDGLRSMLVQEPQGGHRLEKAEILEQTVLFLQNSAVRSEKLQESARRMGSEKNTFQDGFSSCLRRAASFLSPEVSALRPSRTPNDRDARSVLGVLRSTSDSRTRPRAPRLPHRLPEPEERKGAELRPVKRSSKRSPARNSPVSPGLWRPWS